ncbi:MAG: hypothetical protein ACRD0V_19765 [Acidimicrobiales bacterium]
MRSLLLALPALGCAGMMAGMMWLMSRGNKADRSAPPDAPPADTGSQITDLRAEVDRLRAELRTQERTTDPAP